MARTRLINLHTSTEGGYVFIGRPSIFGNPFIVGRDGDREQVCDKFDQYFKERVAIDRSFRETIKELSGKTLACYCVPKRCHGSTIIGYLNNLNLEDEEVGTLIE